MNELTLIEREGERVLTTAQLADAYGTDNKIISYNFNHNKERYTEGKHYYCLTGQEKRDFCNRLEIHDGSKAAVFYLWTEKGALLHAKSLNTDKAWEVYDYLVEHYFRSKEIIEKQSMKALPTTYKEALIQLLEQVEENERLAEENQILTPKAEYHDEVLHKAGLITTTTIAKDLGMSGQKLNAILYINNIIYKQGRSWKPFSKYEWLILDGYADYQSYTNENADPQLKWTEKGRKWIIEHINNWKAAC
ncbi:MAG: phage antirepressor KilAC domain-containing protein [Ruminococcus flavefaciens]|nr:phage antirepressor KilAC domain-containing protein [Ruminococcus flavefaciens]